MVDHVILVDDLSRDDTVAVAELLNLQVVVHRQNLGYGGNQKTCYDTALAEGADVVVMLHPDYQYDATRIPELVAPILAGDADMVLGSRFLGDPLAGGMPRWKFVANRFLTTLQNRAYDLRLSDHTGFRAYSRKLLETIDYRANSNDFVFDQELVGQVVRAGSASPRSGPHPLFRRGQLGRLPPLGRLRPLHPRTLARHRTASRRLTGSGGAFVAAGLVLRLGDLGDAEDRLAEAGLEAALQETLGGTTRRS